MVPHGLSFGMIFSITRFWPLGVRASSPNVPVVRISLLLESYDMATLMTGIALILLSLPRGEVRERYGTWDRHII